MSPLQRGKKFDEILGNNLGDNFPVIDKIDYETRTIHSFKSLDLDAPSYQNPSTLRNTVKGQIDDLNNFTWREWNENLINPKMYDYKQLDLIVPHIPETEEQAIVLKEMLEYAEQKGIIFNLVIAE